jgi:hypothetical protein
MNEVAKGGTPDYLRFRRWPKVTVLVILCSIVMSAVAGNRVLQALFYRSDAPPIEESIPLYVSPPQMPETIASHTFEIKDHWNSSMQLTNLSTSCRCTTATLDRSTLQPGEFAHLTMSMELFDYETRQQASATLHGDLAGRPLVIHFTLRGESAYPLEFSGHSTYQDFGIFQISEARAVHRSVEFKRGILPIQWDKVTCASDDPALTADLVEKEKDDWLLNMLYSPRDYLGSVTSHVTFSFWNHGHRLDCRQEYAAKAQVVGPYYATPPSILFGAVQPGGAASQKVRIQSRDHSHVGIRDVYLPPSSRVQASIVGDDEVLMTFSADSRIGENRGEMIITLNGEPPFKMRERYLATVLGK